ncbi:MAG: DNA cytosine methyltransferase [Treponema sp.]|nr:DNA cytosine methyltransferase [Treponema sp.]
MIVGSKKPFVMDWHFDIQNKKTLDDILEKNVDMKYYASKEIVDKRKSMHTSKYYPSIWHENKSGNISSYPYSCALRAGASYNYLLVNGERRLTPREMLRLQGFPDSFNIVVSDCQARKQAGNAIPVDMVSAVIERFLPIAF